MTPGESDFGPGAREDDGRARSVPTDSSPGRPAYSGDEPTVIDEPAAHDDASNDAGPIPAEEDPTDTDVIGRERAIADDDRTAGDVVGAADGLFDLDRVLGERDEYLDSLRRVQAEFDNYRKRMARQQGELLERATESLLDRLLPVLDALDLAVAHEAPVEGDDGETVSAVAQIAALLRDILTREGLERIDSAEVDFDPTIHDAVVHLPTETTDDAGVTVSPVVPSHRVVVTEVLRSGYRLKGRVLRPAMVQVRG